MSELTPWSCHSIRSVLNTSDAVWHTASLLWPETIHPEVVILTDQEISSVVKRPAARFAGFVLAGIAGLGISAHAACNGPAELVAKLKAHPTTDNAVVLGSWYAVHKQFDCAIPIFQAATKADPKSAQLRYLTGLAYVDNKQAGDALPELQKAVQLDPKVIKPHLMLAFVLEQEGKRREAEEQWSQALAVDPKSTEALEGLSQDLLNRNAFVDTVLLLRGAPRTEKLTINLTKALVNLKMLGEAGDVLTQALNEHPKSLPLSKALIDVFVKESRFQDAIKLAQHFVDVNPKSLDAEMQLFRILVLTNHITQARPLGPKLLAQRPRDLEVRYLNGIVLRSVGDDEGARKLLEQVVSEDPGSPNAHYELGMVFVLLKDWAQARRELEKAIALGEKIPQVHYQLALALRGLGDSSAAQKEIQLFQTLKADDATKLEAAMKAAHADDELKSDKVQQAINYLKEAIEAQPDNANFKYKLALALNRAGDTPGEREQLEQAIKLDPDLAPAQNQMGYLLSRAGESIGAIEHFRQAVHSEPGYVDAWINLAAELAMTGQFPDARDAVAMALRLDPENERAQKLHDRLSQDPAAQLARP
jgi:tetratricopeptide (TPR) repeat protein